MTSLLAPALLQAAVYAPLNRAEMDVWEALGALDSLREYETALLGDDDCDPSLGLKEHALQTAEACRWAAVMAGRISMSVDQ